MAWQTPWVTLLSDEGKWKLAADLPSQHSIMFDHIGSRRGSAPPPYSFGTSSPSLSSPARVLYRGSHDYGYAPPQNTPYRRQYGSESSPLSYSEGTRRRRSVIPPYGIGESSDIKRPSKVFSDHRASVGSTLYDPLEKDPGYSPTLYESDPNGIGRFKDEDEINFNILR